jgi:histone-lysine N-methyltransferase SETD1
MFGKVESLTMLEDPNSGASLGLWHLRYEGSTEESNRHAKKLIQNANTINIDMKTPRICFDETGERGQKLMKNILIRKSTDITKIVAPSGPQALRGSDGSRPRSPSPRRNSSVSGPYLPSAPTIYMKYEHKFPPSILPSDLKPAFKSYDYDYMTYDSRGIYVIFDSSREARACFERLDGLRTPDGYYRMHMTLHGQGLQRRLDRREDDLSRRDSEWRLDKRDKLALSRRESELELRAARRESDLDRLRRKDRESDRLESARSSIDEPRREPQPREGPKNIKSEATAHIISELQSFLLKDIRERVLAPAIYEFLHPDRFKSVTQEIKKEPLTTTPQNEKVETFATEVTLTDNKLEKTSVLSIRGEALPSLPRFKKRHSQEHSKQIVKPRQKKIVRPMNHRLNYSSSDESEPSSSQRSTPALNSVDTMTSVESAAEKSPVMRKRGLKLRVFDYTSSESEDEEEEQPETKRIKLEPLKQEKKLESKSMISPVKSGEIPDENALVSPESIVAQPPTKPSPAQTLSLFKPEGVEEESEEEESIPDATSKVFRPNDHQMSLEMINPVLQWAPSQMQPEPVCHDNDDTLLDLDGFQSLIKDSEDWQLIKHVLVTTKPEPMAYPQFSAWDRKEIKSINNGGHIGPTVVGSDIAEKLRWTSSTGASRSEGYFKIPEADKAAYLPHRKKIHKPIDTLQFEGSAKEQQQQQAGTLSSRMNRVNNRRLQADISLQKEILGSETDILKFNALKKRKKPVKFARSAIHNWGLYAIEPIAANEMIIEYVGEIVRQKVAERRERNYLKSGIGSSYLFRIDESTVIDATKRGGIARFINHCCTPSCTAKIIKVEGQKRIVIYALRDIAADEELTYDYKFEREQNGEERIPCLCGAPGCKGFLN